MNQQVIDICLLDRKYKIKCDLKESELLKTTASELSTRIKQIQHQKRLSLLDATLLAALNLCAEKGASKQTIESSERKDLLPEQLREINDKILSALET